MTSPFLRGKALSDHVEKLKVNAEDFEWYPTTQKQIDLIKADIDLMFLNHPSVLDLGAGDGRVLMQLTEGKRMAVEKSRLNLAQLDHSIFITGTDFWAENLMAKKAEVVFCNPPYSEYASWMTRIIKTMNARVVYFVVPKRWRENEEILLALKDRLPLRITDLNIRRMFRKNDMTTAQFMEQVSEQFDRDCAYEYDPEMNDEWNESNRDYYQKNAIRNCQVYSLGLDDFISADRSARAEVELVRINLDQPHNDKAFEPNQNFGGGQLFERWFMETFGDAPAFNPSTEVSTDVTPVETLEHEIITARGGVPKVLAERHQAEMDHYISNIQQVVALDSALLSSIGVDIEQVKGSLKTKMEEIGPRYWEQLFNFYEPITHRLCQKQREQMLKTIIDNANTGFTLDNIYAVTEWVIKNSSEMVNEQLKEAYEAFIEPKNIKAFKSNEKLFGELATGFRHMSRFDFKRNVERFYFDYRMICSRGGLDSETNGFYPVGLKDEAVQFINDLMVVAYNLGFDTRDSLRAHQVERWDKEQKTFCYLKDGKEVPLFKVRAHLKGTMHFTMAQDFALALNVEYSRLMGWVKNSQEAVKEHNITKEKDQQFVQAVFGINEKTGFQLGTELEQSLLLPEMAQNDEPEPVPTNEEAPVIKAPVVAPPAKGAGEIKKVAAAPVVADLFA